LIKLKQEQTRDRSGRDLWLRSIRLAFVSLLIAFLLNATDYSQTAQTDGSEVSPDVAARLQQQIASDSIEAKRAALFEIRNLRSAWASRLAIPALRDKNLIVRASAAASVVFAPKAEASAALIPLLNDKDEFVRRESAYALGDVQDRSATAPLTRLLQDDKIIEVKTAAANALGKIGDVSAISALLTILKTRPREDDEFLRRSAARSIGQIAQINITGDATVLTPQNFLPEKFKDLGSSDPTVSIAQSFTGSVDVLTAVLQNKRESDDTRREAAYALGAIGDKRSVPVLQAYLAGADPYLAEICKEALLKIERRNKVSDPSD
jgi:HEAT repeat protein